MWILALDSSTETGSCALLEDGILRAQIFLCNGNTHSTTLLPAVEQILRFASLDPAGIDAFACTIGPGSFTGIRIGAATVKGLAFRQNKPCFGLSTLEALAENLRGVTGTVLPVLDARRNQVYTARFQSSGSELVRMTEDCILPLEDLASYVPEGPVYLCGDAVSAARTVLPDAVCLPHAAQPLAASVAELARRRFEAGERPSDLALHPLYLRLPQAEETLRQKLAGAKSES